MSGLVEGDNNSTEDIHQPMCVTPRTDDDLQRVLELSEQEERQRLEELDAERRQEEEMLEQVLKLSLMEKWHDYALADGVSCSYQTVVLNQSQLNI